MEKLNKYRIGILATNPTQYYVPWYQALARHPRIDLKVFYCHRQTPKDQAEAGFGVEFDWDIPLFEGYEYRFLENRALRPNVFSFFGCDTPDIRHIIYEDTFDAFIVHGWYAKSFWQAIRTCWRKGTPVLIRGDSYLFTNYLCIKRWLKYPLYRWFIPKFDAYLTVGEHTKKYYLHYGADERRMYFVPHAVDNEFFVSNYNALIPERENLRKNWGIPKDAVLFLFAGKLIPKKRPFDFIKALQLAKRRERRIYGLIVGDGPLRHKLETRVQKGDLPVAFTGFLNQKDITKAYVVSDALVLPSGTGETWGLVVNEAMACGLPAIVSDRVGCALDLIHPGQTGEEFQCGDIKRLAKIIEEFTSQEERLRCMKRNAKNFIDKYSINASISGALEAFKFVVNNKKINNHEKNA